MKKLLLALGAIACFGISSCKKNDESKSLVTTSQMSFRLTDAPGAYEAVYIDVQGIEVNHETKGWISLNVDKPGRYNLLDLRNGADVLLCQSDVPSGKVNQVRLILGSNNSVKVKGKEYPLDAPSAEQSGLKLNLMQDLKADASYSFWLDFDAGKSVVETGSGSYKLKPLLRTYTQATNGKIKGSIGVLYTGTIIYAINGTDTFSTYPNNDGSFLFCGLPEASYNLRIETSTTASLTLSGISVTFGSITDLGVLTLIP